MIGWQGEKSEAFFSWQGGYRNNIPDFGGNPRGHGARVNLDSPPPETGRSHGRREKISQLSPHAALLCRYCRGWAGVEMIKSHQTPFI